VGIVEDVEQVGKVRWLVGGLLEALAISGEEGKAERRGIPFWPGGIVEGVFFYGNGVEGSQDF
jgi:hypothetical protein